MKPVKIYSKENCPYCTAAKDFFTEMEVEYTEVDVLDEVNQEEHMRLAEEHNHMTVPMILIGDEFVGGYDNLMELQKEGKLDAMLQD